MSQATWFLLLVPLGFLLAIRQIIIVVFHLQRAYRCPHTLPLSSFRSAMPSGYFPSGWYKGWEVAEPRAPARIQYRSREQIHHSRSRTKEALPLCYSTRCEISSIKTLLAFRRHHNRGLHNSYRVCGFIDKWVAYVSGCQPSRVGDIHLYSQPPD